MQTSLTRLWSAATCRRFGVFLTVLLLSAFFLLPSSFATLTVANLGPSNVTSSSAVLWGQLTATNGNGLTVTNTCTVSNLTAGTVVIGTNVAVQFGVFSIPVTGLSNDAAYSAQFASEDLSSGWSYSAVTNFVTWAGTPGYLITNLNLFGYQAPVIINTNTGAVWIQLPNGSSITIGGSPLGSGSASVSLATVLTNSPGANVAPTGIVLSVKDAWSSHHLIGSNLIDVVDLFTASNQWYEVDKTTGLTNLVLTPANAPGPLAAQGLVTNGNLQIGVRSVSGNSNAWFYGINALSNAVNFANTDATGGDQINVGPGYYTSGSTTHGGGTLTVTAPAVSLNGAGRNFVTALGNLIVLGGISDTIQNLTIQNYTRTLDFSNDQCSAYNCDLLGGIDTVWQTGTTPQSNNIFYCRVDTTWDGARATGIGNLLRAWWCDFRAPSNDVTAPRIWMAYNQGIKCGLDLRHDSFTGATNFSCANVQAVQFSSAANYALCTILDCTFGPYATVPQSNCYGIVSSGSYGTLTLGGNVYAPGLSNSFGSTTPMVLWSGDADVFPTNNVAPTGTTTNFVRVPVYDWAGKTNVYCLIAAVPQ
jgi:hypothetical protein